MHGEKLFQFCLCRLKVGFQLSRLNATALIAAKSSHPALIPSSSAADSTISATNR
jgi:hypothetical protein